MGRSQRGVPIAALAFAAFLCAGCGGGSSSYVAPPPPVPDFSLVLSTNSVSVQQGATNNSLNVSVTPLNGFTGSVQISLSGLPAGVISNPASPFTLASGANTQIIFGAAANAATGTFMVSAKGTSGALSHNQSLNLIVQSAAGSALPRTTYARTDATSAADNPFGEPHHRHVAYDPANKHIFVANRAMNRVDVFSSMDQTRVAQISIPGASSADLSADGTTIWVGTSLEQIVAVNVTSLQVTTRYLLAGLTPIPGTIFNRPEEVLSLSNGNCLVRLRQPASSEALLALWDPVSNALTNLTSTAPALFQQGLGVLARSGDHSKVLAAANDSSGEIAIYNATGSVVVGPLALGASAIPSVAANPDATRFAVVFAPGGNTQVVLLDGSLNQVGVYTPATVHGVAFSRAGNSLYVSESSASGSFITVLDGHTAQLVGRVPDVAIQGVSSQIEDVDETQLLFGLSNRGISFVDAATPGTLSSTAPSLAPAPSLQPSGGPNVGGTSVVLAGQNFISPAQLKFGTQLVSNVTVSGTAQILASSPPNAATGALNVTTFFLGGWLALAPDAFSYGPQILQILPNAGVPAGGDTVQIYGYGFGSDPTKLAVTIGGTSATVQSAVNVTSITSSLGLDTTYPFSIERITLQTPAWHLGHRGRFHFCSGRLHHFSQIISISAKRAILFETRSVQILAL